jgi:hypothetical protein
MNLPNLLSLLRIALLPFVVLCLKAGQNRRALGLMLLAAATDYFDGLLARRLHQVTDSGKMIDPLSAVGGHPYCGQGPADTAGRSADHEKTKVSAGLQPNGKVGGDRDGGHHHLLYHELAAMGAVPAVRLGGDDRGFGDIVS